jgi:hypothetical protein
VVKAKVRALTIGKSMSVLMKALMSLAQVFRATCGLISNDAVLSWPRSGAIAVAGPPSLRR